ncbi:MAG: CHRD domain-containing protein [Acidimicrobiia bacterium]
MIPAYGAHEGTAYEAQLEEINNSGATGEAYVEVSEDGETMSVDITASGFNLDSPHAMHIHAIVDGDNVTASSCPTMSADADGDGVVDVVEGVPFYGAVQVSLTTEGDTSADSALAVERFPASTELEYSRSGIAIPEALKPNLDKVHIVVHGLDENGNGTLDMDQEIRSSLTDDLPREATAPALCGELTAFAQGAVQTGAGGTADNGTSWAMMAAGLSVVAIAAIAINRRPRDDV